MAWAGCSAAQASSGSTRAGSWGSLGLVLPSAEQNLYMEKAWQEQDRSPAAPDK